MWVGGASPASRGQCGRALLDPIVLLRHWDFQELNDAQLEEVAVR